MSKKFNIEEYFSPKPTDKEYVQEEQLRISLICRTDSYKFSHPYAYSKKKKIQAMTAYGTARVTSKDLVVPAGMQIFVKEYLTQRITMKDVESAEAFCLAHFGRPLFDRAAWEKVVNVYDGYLPVIIRAVPEGTRLYGGLPIYTVTVFDEDLFWMVSSIETMLVRAIWYTTTVATMDANIKPVIKEFYETTGADLNLLPFALHDFGGRGVTCGEQAENGGFAHTISFMGSDTVEGILTSNFYYKHAMAAFSVYATEHSVECSFGGGREDAIEYIRTQLANAPAGSIISIVIDGYDAYRETELCCTVLKDEIIATGAKVVFRPDSGDMMEVVPHILHAQEKAFGVTLTSKGFKKINHVGVIQGDGVDHLTIRSLLGKITIICGFSADCVVFGSGGGLLQKLNRDTLKFAQKSCAILLPDGTWQGIAKDPVTDQGKKSKEGVLTTARHKVTGELKALRLDTGELTDEYEDIMQLVYFKGDLYNETTLDEVRTRVEAV